MKGKKPIVLISSYPPRLCGIATFCEEVREFVQKANPARDVLVLSHKDGGGDGVYPLIDTRDRYWWKPVAKKVEKLDPYAVHIQHEYGLYEHRDDRGIGDHNAGFIELLGAINSYPVVVEPHTVHGRLKDFEANFIYQMCRYSDVVIFKCHYQKWRLNWTFTQKKWEMPKNIMVIPHGARPDRRWGMEEIPKIRKELGLEKLSYLSENLVGLVGWIQSNKRWDILTSMWEDIQSEIHEKTGKHWDLLAAGTYRNRDHYQDYQKYKKGVEILEQKGLAHYYEFTPRGDVYYKVMALCGFIVLPTVDETQSGTLARIIALNKPFITTAPMEGLTAQTLESRGGLLFTNKGMLREKVIRLASDGELRMNLGNNLKKYLENVVSWEVVCRQYNQAYRFARDKKLNKKQIDFPVEF